ncbi:AtpZ/AtpI family protein [Aliifodinibius sp. S!AR15-10]|uniref:AtpZ/AtpI family protein n=1 Tax=Aliifodinibius sp. S!AR15-10 TaxID=2950437 RepID=UPI0028562A39|nr:AtpZ/AtpI family protein [Aliifodinibius sp. S!AR15-10]MDR8393258.1 AtpZ/AtpI family protein [Aliifodinibius sp. S!AR15-10]
MTDDISDKRRQFVANVGEKSERRSKARQEKKRGIWFGLGMFGLVGWSVAVPALLLLGLGIWIDRTWDSDYSWTLMLLVLGVGLGCMNAWYWVKKESEGQE